jgi:predicted O-methyltransferase YrrM
MSHPFVNEIADVCSFLGAPRDRAAELIADLERSELAAKIGGYASGIEQFANANIKQITSLHLFRTFLYVLVRLRRPRIFLETGVLHGFGSAFILQGLEDNQFGRLISIDLPHTDGSYLAQGSSVIPQGCCPGWAIPPKLRARHDLRLGKAERLLPAYFLGEEAPDIFMHDSDHAYEHIAFEISLAWKFLQPGSLLVVDNVEANDAFQDFAEGVACRCMTVTSYPKGHPEYWIHGLAIR